MQDLGELLSGNLGGDVCCRLELKRSGVSLLEYDRIVERLKFFR